MLNFLMWFNIGVISVSFVIGIVIRWSQMFGHVPKDGFSPAEEKIPDKKV